MERRDVQRLNDREPGPKDSGQGPLSSKAVLTGLGEHRAALHWESTELLWTGLGEHRAALTGLGEH